MALRMDDIADVIADQPAGGVGYRQGTIVTFNQQTGENTVYVGRKLFTNLPMFNVNEVASLVPGAVVGILTWQPGDGASSWFILGTIATPLGSGWKSAPASAVIITGENLTNQSYSDLATVGPQVTVYIGASGRATAIWGASEGQLGTLNGGGSVGIAVSGATTIAATNDYDMKFSWAQSEGLLAAALQACITHHFSGLNRGLTTFTLKYRCVEAAQQVSFAERELLVIPW